jgi:hypothetical protein
MTTITGRMARNTAGATPLWPPAPGEASISNGQKKTASAASEARVSTTAVRGEKRIGFTTTPLWRVPSRPGPR